MSLLKTLLVLASASAVMGEKLIALPSSNSYSAPVALPPPPPPPAQPQGYSYGPPELDAAASDVVEAEVDPLVALAANIPGGGVPGEDYPILASVPDTGFSCGDVEFPGYYADTADEAGCQVFHICQEGGRQDSFLCPNGTVFHQQYFVCNWWFNVDCAASTEFYGLNEQIGLVPDLDALASVREEEEVAPPSDLYGVPQETVQEPSNLYGLPARF